MADAVRSGKLTENRANLEGDAMYMENRALQRRLAEAEKFIPHCCECCSHQQSGGRCALLPEGDEFSIDYTEGYDRDDCEHWELRVPTKQKGGCPMLEIKRMTTVPTSWVEIKEAAKNGTLHELLTLGDELPITLKTGEEVTLQLADMTLGDRPCFVLKQCARSAGQQHR